MGHALNKIIKDFIVRYKTMQGYYAPFVPGWDTWLTYRTSIEKKGVDRKKCQLPNSEKNVKNLRLSK